MIGSSQIGTAFGIPVRVHWSFLLLLLLPTPVSWLVALFGSVLVHELGHALVARHLGVRVLDVTLWPLGGMARLASMPEEPRIEAWVALAGPAVNVVAAAVFGCLSVLAHVAGLPTLAAGCMVLLLVNAMLGAFNLLPAFPMDGGRVLRAWLARTRGWVRATEIAARVGRWAAVAMILAPVLLRPLPGSLRAMAWSLPLVGLFVLVAGVQELVVVRLRHAGARRSQPFEPFEPAQASASPPPPEPDGPDEAGGARRPRQWEGEIEGGRRGFDETAVAALERFRGRMRRSDTGG